MVRTLLAGSKTQTRRVVKPQPLGGVPTLLQHLLELGHQRWATDEPDEEQVWKCPYGQPGDRLWVREAHALENRYRNVWCSYRADDARFIVPAPQLVDVVRPGWRPSIHMPRWASRISLEVTGVRIERLQDISTSDAWAEGIPDAPPPGVYVERVDEWVRWSDGVMREDPKAAYRQLWDSINGPGAWDSNPFVWCVSFRRIDADQP